MLTDTTQLNTYFKLRAYTVSLGWVGPWGRIRNKYVPLACFSSRSVAFCLPISPTNLYKIQIMWKLQQLAKQKKMCLKQRWDKNLLHANISEVLPTQ